jgi:GDP-mannose 6-dehydrogenase
MNITIFGMGYVGVVTAACLCQDGHHVIGVDVSRDKVDLLNQGKSPVIEDQVETLIGDARKSGRFEACTDAAFALGNADMCIICVGTPSERNGSLKTSFVEAVVAEIGDLLAKRVSPLLVVVRSTLLPGTMRSLVLKILSEKSGSQPGEKFEALFHPEFLREGSSVKDYYDPPKIVVGERVPGTGEKLLALYKNFSVPIFRTSYETAEMVKYCDNIFHALKVTFSNEIGSFCKAQGIDSREVMDVFCHDTKLNLSPKYLRPGFAFGGSCLPKDLRAFLFAAHRSDLAVPMLSSIPISNKEQIERAAEEILGSNVRTVGLHGLAFKPGTDDLRESPQVALAEMLNGKGVDLKIYDEFVQVGRLVGGNKAFVEQTLPHLARLLVPSLSDLAQCELIVLGHPIAPEIVAGWLASGKKLYDLTGMKNLARHENLRSVV